MMRPGDLSDWQKLVKMIGEESAGALSALYGGGRMYVPKILGAHHPITQTVGREAAIRLVVQFGGQPLDIPISLGKRIQIQQLVTGGVSVAEICRRVGVSRRTVFYVKAGMRDGVAESEDPEHPDLFS
jgi:DNA-binding NarL/FixJ family response regulator